MSGWIFHGGRFLDPRQDELLDGLEVYIEGQVVKEVSDRPIHGGVAQRVDLKGKTMMPGLIDAHAHVYLSDMDFRRFAELPLSLVTLRATRTMREMLRRGFTTVRDVAGGDLGIKTASDLDIVEGPRLSVAGRAISQTGGHGDFRRRTDDSSTCSCCSGLALTSRIADGVAEITHAVRDELRRGADFIKIMVSGGVISQSDPLLSNQLNVDEIGVACRTAQDWGTYVAAHAYAGTAIERAVTHGVRTIEHGNFLTPEAAAKMKERGAFLVPTLVTYDAMRRRGNEFGLTEYSAEKNKTVLDAGFRAIETALQAGVPIGLGTDLIGQLQDEQSREFQLRRELQKPAEVMRSCLLINARILNQEHKLGELVPGAHADFLVIDGDPLTDISVLCAPDRILEIWRSGRRRLQ